MKERDELPVFPNIIPDQIDMSEFHIIEVDDVQSEEDLQHLITLMFNHPERDFYYFQKKDGPTNQYLYKGDFIMNRTEFFFYKHPKFERDYIKISREGGQCDWEKEVIEKGPVFVRIKLELSGRKKRELEIYQKLEMEKMIDSNPFELKPNL